MESSEKPTNANIALSVGKVKPKSICVNLLTTKILSIVSTPGCTEYGAKIASRKIGNTQPIWLELLPLWQKARIEMEVTKGTYYVVEEYRGMFGIPEKPKTLEAAYKLIKQLNDREKKDGVKVERYAVFREDWKRTKADDGTVLEYTVRKTNVSTAAVDVFKQIIVTDEDIDDIMVGALEGGINYWCSEAEIAGEYLGEYASDQISRGGELIIHDSEAGKKYKLDKSKIIDGIRRAYEEGYGNYGYGQRWIDGDEIDCCNVDGPLADVIVQLALFGEVRYA